MKQSIREKTCLIVRKNRHYLVGVDVFGFLKWSTSQYDAWRTRDRDAAEMVARKTGGTLMLFNPIVNQIKIFDGGRHGRGKVL